jgi:hypothetical protein
VIRCLVIVLDVADHYPRILIKVSVKRGYGSTCYRKVKKKKLRLKKS